MSNNSKLNRFLNGKGFYIALGICMIAIGISAWTAISKTSGPPEINESNNTAQIVSNGQTSKDTEANTPQSDIPHTLSSDTVKETESSKEDTVTSKETESAVEQTPTAGYFVYPVVGEVIKKFSDSELQYSVTFNDMRLHLGIDIKADAGTSVKASGDGKVLEVKNDPELGYTVKIDHGNGITALYSGLAKAVAVKSGETVKSGTNLGALGTVNNECLDAPHLHLEFFREDKPIDPLELMSK